MSWLGVKYASLNPQSAEGANWPIECQIDLQPGCKFKCFCCLKVYVKMIDKNGP